MINDQELTIKDGKTEGVDASQQGGIAYIFSSWDSCHKRKISVLSTWRGESDYVVQYNFYDVSHAQIHGGVV